MCLNARVAYEKAKIHGEGEVKKKEALEAWLNVEVAGRVAFYNGTPVTEVPPLLRSVDALANAWKGAWKDAELSY